jgi:hypothetical protein
MRNKLNSGPVLRAIGAACALLLVSGCQSYLAFGTATKFGLDISQRADQQPEITMGYRRAEMASIPTAETAAKSEDASATKDAYSVLARFAVSYDSPFATDSKGLRLRQFFATGMAARKAAATPDMQTAFGNAAHEVKEEAETKEAGK